MPSGDLASRVHDSRRQWSETLGWWARTLDQSIVRPSEPSGPAPCTSLKGRHQCRQPLSRQSPRTRAASGGGAGQGGHIIHTM